MLRERARELRERMDDPACDPQRLWRTYSQFAIVNRLVGGWGALLERYLRPRLKSGSRLLDIGCGGGDLARRIHGWARERDVAIHIVAVDPDARALRYARSKAIPPGVEFRQVGAQELLLSGERFDVVVSNHLLHHLPEDHLGEFLAMTGELTTGLALHNDLRRHPLAYAAFSLTRPFFRGSFIVEDGLTSIRRSYTDDELRPLLPPGWRLECAAPFRNLAVLER